LRAAANGRYIASIFHKQGDPHMTVTISVSTILLAMLLLAIIGLSAGTWLAYRALKAHSVQVAIDLLRAIQQSLGAAQQATRSPVQPVPPAPEGQQQPPAA
jgi:hypothetical protein